MPPIRDLWPLLGIAEPFSSLSHLITAAVAVALFPVMLRRALGDAGRVVSVTLYAAGAITMMTASGIYHGLAASHPLRPLFWRLDHGSIWFVLAATFACVRVCAVDGRWGGRWQAGLWGVALTGIALEVANIDRLPLWISPSLYIGMGWLGLPTLLAFIRRHGPGPLSARMWIGGLAATAGGLMDAGSWPHLMPGLLEAHELCHVGTAIGGVCYYTVILTLADGRLHPATAPVPADGDDEGGAAVPATLSG